MAINDPLFMEIFKVWALVTLPIRLAVQSSVISWILPFFVPYNTWWFLLKQFGTEEQLKQQSILTRIGKTALKRFGDAGDDLMEDIHGKILGKVNDRLDEIKYKGDVLLDNIQGGAKHAMDNIHQAGDTLLDSFTNITQGTSEKFQNIRNRTKENLAKIQTHTGKLYVHVVD